MGPLLRCHARGTGRNVSSDVLGDICASPACPDHGAHDPDESGEAPHVRCIYQGAAAHRRAGGKLVVGRVCRLCDRSRKPTRYTGYGGHRPRLEGSVVAMRIGVDATCWHNRRGYGRHARALLRALIRLDTGNRYTLFLDSTEPAEPTPDGCEVRLVRPSVPTVRAASANGRRSLADMWRMSRALSASEFEVLLFPTIYSYVPVRSRALKLVMVHDVIAETFPQLTLPRLSSRVFWNTKVALGRMQADALITVSDYSRDCILKRFGTDPRHVFVVGEAADPIFRRLDHAEPGPKLRQMGLGGTRRLAVYVGGFSPHKNLEALVAAFARIAAKREFDDVLL